MLFDGSDPTARALATGSLITESMGELAAEPLVLLDQESIVLVGCLQPDQQRGIRGPLRGRDGGGRVVSGGLA
jgi:hypothetical protein